MNHSKSTEKQKTTDQRTVEKVLFLAIQSNKNTSILCVCATAYRQHNT